MYFENIIYFLIHYRTYNHAIEQHATSEDTKQLEPVYTTNGNNNNDEPQQQQQSQSNSVLTLECPQRSPPKDNQQNPSAIRNDHHHWNSLDNSQT